MLLFVPLIIVLALAFGGVGWYARRSYFVGFTPPDWVMEQYARTMNTGEPLVLDGLAYRHPGLGPDEHYLDVRAAPFAGALSVTWRDVTDRMRQARSGE